MSPARAVQTVEGSRVGAVARDEYPFAHQLVERVAHGRRLLDEPLLDQPPLDDAFERVLRVPALGQVLQQAAGDVRFRRVAHTDR